MRVTRSRKIQLVLLASTSLGLAGCDGGGDQQARAPSPGDAIQADVVPTETVQADVTLVEPGRCREVGLNEDGSGTPTFTDDYCERMQREALEDFDRTAPLYGSFQACADVHGAEGCSTAPRTVQRDGEIQSGYMPAFTGFLVGTAAALAAAHVVNSLSAQQQGQLQRPIPVYTSLSEDCRREPRDQRCRRSSGGGTAGNAYAGGGGRAGGYTYGYNGYTVAEPSPTSPGRTTTTVTRGATGTFAPATTARAGFGSSASSGVSATARGGFGASAGAHAGGGGHGGGGT